MTTPGVEVRPIELIDGGYEVNEVWFTDVRVPAANLVGAENQGWEIAKFLLGNERVGVAPVGAVKRVLAHAKEWVGEDTLRDPLVAARFAAIENELLALELTALRVVANSADGKPHPASSVLKLKGSELQQAVSDLVVELAGPGSLASGAGDDSGVPGWARRRHPGVPQPAQGLDLRRLQRDPAPDHRPHDPGTLRGIRTWTSSTTTSSRPCVTPSAGCWPRPTATSRSGVRRPRASAATTRSMWRQLAEMGVLGLPFAEADGGMGAGPIEVGIVAEELGRVLAPEPFLTAVVLAGGAVAAAGSDAQRSALLEPLAAGESLLAWAHDEPGNGYTSSAVGHQGLAGGRRLDPDRHQGAGRRTASTPTSSS